MVFVVLTVLSHCQETASKKNNMMASAASDHHSTCVNNSNSIYSLDAAIDELRANGTIDTILNKYDRDLLQDG